MTERLKLSSSEELRSASGAVLGVLVGASAAALTLLSLGLSGVVWLTYGPVLLGPVAALLIVGSVLAGVPAVLGVVLGVLGYQLLNGSIAGWELLGTLVFGVVFIVSWDSFERVETRESLPVSLTAVSRFLASTALAALWSAIVIGLGYQLTGGFPFFPTAPFAALDATLSAVLFGGPMLLVGALLQRSRPTTTVRLSPDWTASVGRTLRTPLFVVATGWFLLASGVSIGFQLVELVPKHHFRLRDLGVLLVLKSDVFGMDGSAIQLVLGCACLALTALLVYRSGRGRPE